ncbi:type IV pilus modification PilV family protein [Ectobacillus ponti]|uniref:Prepilin-type N-terminal cleavage/methylation domain-containing protein n=1 Tax=Ectobacillus ponti TaxID=2961894 RepID=A0AA41X881_9BACI|nr:prepilin-type N-terminal cleavage/methylation domain-containing protein [Ectobacillus ponti]MCP8968494.1 prepilin-type N-terminal cleavage/methylation domain-containing protein [Ectobacillus ponti]
MKNSKESGMTLVEVLASVTILAVLALGMLSIFPKALSFTKASQLKTVAINLARGALQYMNKQDYDLLTGYRDAAGGRPAVLSGAESCTAQQTVLLDGKSVTSPLFPNADSCTKLLEPTINNTMYKNKQVLLFFMPLDWTATASQQVLQSIRSIHSKTDTGELAKQLASMEHAPVQSAQPTLEVLAYVDLNLDDKQPGVLLKGGVAHESLR